MSAEPQKPVKTPVVLQMEAIECGAACIAIIAEHFGLVKPLEYWREACGVSRDGVKAKQMLTAARNHGLDAKGFKTDAEGLVGLTWPLVVFWEFNHFLVLEGLDAESAWLNDPAVGPRRVSREEFEKGFTGVALHVSAGESFEREGKRKSAWDFLKERLSGAQAALGLILATGFLLTVPNLVVPTFNRIIADYFILESHPDWYWPMVASMSAVAAAQALLTWMQGRQLLRLDAKLALTGTATFFWHALHLPLRYFAHRNASEVGSRTILNDKIAGTATNRLAAAVIGTLTMVVYGIVMLQYNVGLTVLAVLFAALNLLVLRLVQERQTNINRRLLVEEARYYSLASRGLQNVEDLLASGGATRFTNKLLGHHADVISQRQKLGTNSTLLDALPKLLGTFGILALMLFGGLDVMNGVITVGMLIAFQMLMGLFSAPVGQLLGLGSDIQTMTGEMERLDDVLLHPKDAPLEVNEGGFEKPLVQLQGDVAFKDVSFAYSTYAPAALDKLSFSVSRGECVALVGVSGGGKSTIARLIAGLYEPTAGKILFDGIAAGELDRAIVSDAIGYVDQDVKLFEGTVAENLAMSDVSPASDLLISCAKAACIYEVIMGRPGGFSARVAPGGSNFSGGERQRIELARALMRKPAILLLDEATSALDAETERAVINNLLELGTTVIFVSHRLTALQWFDTIHMLKDGTIVESGSFSELCRRSGPFIELLARPASSEGGGNEG